jgi:hypothetical protein
MGHAAASRRRRGWEPGRAMYGPSKLGGVRNKFIRVRNVSISFNVCVNEECVDVLSTGAVAISVLHYI